MSRYQIIGLVILFLMVISSCKEKVTKPIEGAEKAFELSYPKTFRDTSIVDDYHGTKVLDPYRWLENENGDATKDWVRQQNRLTYAYLDQIPFRDEMEDRLESLWNYARYTAPKKVGQAYTYFKNNGLQDQDVLVLDKTLGEQGETILDPNQFSEDGSASLALHSFSKDGQYLAYGIAEGGSDWRTIYIKDLEQNALLTDTVRWVKFSNIAWRDKGFFYSRYPEPQSGEKLSGKNEFHQVFYHQLGTPQSEDELVFADRRHPQRNFRAETTQDERYLLVSASRSTSGNQLYFKDLKRQSDFSIITKSFKDDFELVGRVKGGLLFRTNHQAPNYRVILVNPSKPDASYWQEIIPESENVIRDATLAKDKIVVSFLENASSRLKIYSKKGKYESEVLLPGLGTIGEIQANPFSDKVYFSFTSFINPISIYEFDVSTNLVTLFKKPDIDFDAAQFETKQILYTSSDGTKIPMFITYKKGLELNGENPTLLYGYGGFNISILPSFDPTKAAFLEQGGIYAVANIRGGGEFGKQWHKAGTLENKENVFDDFIAAAEYLIEKKYTNPQKLGIQGRSNGGLLVGACMTKRPDLFKVAMPAVGVMDMLRYHQFTIGWAWAGDYGRSDDEAQFKYLYAYSPLHNIEAQTAYPATIITTADHDDRVVPAHSYKFASELQHHQNGDAPVLIRIDTSAGHGAGKPTSKKIEEAADVMSFLFYNLEMDFENEVE